MCSQLSNIIITSVQRSSSKSKAADTKVKLTASQSRVICTRLVAAAWARTLESVDMMKSFLELGYVWNDNSPVCPRTLPGYMFDPTTIDILDTTIDLVTADEKKIDNDAQNAKELHTQHLDKQGQNKQMTILDMWKKNNVDLQ